MDKFLAFGQGLAYGVEIVIWDHEQPMMIGQELAMKIDPMQAANKLFLEQASCEAGKPFMVALFCILCIT